VLVAEVDVPNEVLEHQSCAVEGCSEQAVWDPVILLFPPYGGPAEIHVELPHCPTHKAAATLEDVMSDSHFADLTQILIGKGKLPPVRDKTRLVFKEIMMRH
jgi:hypothetical protein